MTNSTVKFYLKKEYILIVLSESAKYSVIYSDLKNKLVELKKFYENNKMPIIITGKLLNESQKEQLKTLFLNFLGIGILFKYDTEQSKVGLHAIKSVFSEKIENSNTRFCDTSLRSGSRIEVDGSVVIIGDINSGAEVIAGENIIVLGKIRGLVHAGAKGNLDAYIITKEIDTKQVRIANIIKTRDIKMSSNSFLKMSVIDGSIIIEN